jgi:hypothetical protein
VFYQDVFNVKDYGALGNGVANDTASVNATITAALASTNGGAVYFPAGTYNITSTLNFSCAKSLMFVGDGPASVLKATATFTQTDACFIQLTSTAEYTKFHFRNLVMLSDIGTATLTAVRCVCLPAATTHRDNLVLMDNVQIRSNGTTQNWLIGVRITYASNAVFSNCTFCGTTNAGPGIGLQIDGNSVNTMISNCNFNFWEFGIWCPVYQEGITVVNSLFIAVKWGFYSKTNATDGLRSTNHLLTGTHIDVRNGGRALWFENVSEVFVADCLFNNGGGGTSNELVYFLRVFEAGITNTQIYGPANIGIYLGGLSGSGYTPAQGILYSIGVTILGCNFRGQATEIYADTYSRNIVARSNTKSDGSSNFSNTIQYINFVDNGSYNQIEDSVVVGVNTTVQKTVNQTLANNSETAVVWASERYSGGFDIWRPATSTSNLYVPAGAKRVRVSAGIRWGVAGGDFILKIKDQSNVSWARDNRYASAGVGAGVTIISAIIDVTASGVSSFYVTAQQSTLNPLDIVADAATYFTLEVL